MNNQDFIHIEATVKAPIEKVWQCWTDPADITQWNCASPDWHSPRASNDLSEGGKFNFRMEARDGSMGFDFEGVYDKITPLQLIAYRIGDGRKVRVQFSQKDGATHIKESFEPENTHSREMQEAGWQSILNNFKQYTEKKTTA
jgi:uncharacterized protein YndB with AHSA1/START domain